MKTKVYEIKRTVEEIFYVEASTKKEAALNALNPASVTVKREKITVVKN